MEAKLKQIVAELFEADVTKVHEDFLLSTRRMQGSLARAKLDAAIRHRLGVTCRGVYSAKTYGELHKAVLGVASHDESGASVAAVSQKSNSETAVPVMFNGMGAGTGMSCGIDVEMVEGFPEVDDYWKDSFYTNSFSSVEIAYCLLQDHPRMHFAARWCAKEALKKCQPSYLHEEMKNIELVSKAEASPILRHYQDGIPTPIPFAVSISHTTNIAVAMVVQQATSS